MSPEQLRARITRSGLSVSRWARDVAGRDVRTVQRWCAGDIAIPASAVAWLDRIESVRATAHRTTIRVRAAAGSTQ